MTDRLYGSMCRQLAEACHDVFGEENPPIFFLFVANRVIANRVDNTEIRWMDCRVVGEPKDVDEFVNKDVNLHRRQRGRRRSRSGWWTLSKANVSIDLCQSEVGI